jgi:hypothetical protein
VIHAGWIGIIDAAQPGMCIFKDNPLANPLSALSTTFISFFLLLFNLFLFIANLIYFAKERGSCSVKRYFITDDPFGFRIEQIGVIAMLLATVFLSLYPLIYHIIRTVRNNPDNDVYSFQSELFGILLSVSYFIFELGLLASSSFVGLIVAIFSYIRKKFRTKVFENEFVAFINTKEGMKIFKDYSTREWSSENVLFYEEILKFNQIKKFKIAQKNAKNIMENYVEIGSPFEVNLSGDVRKLTKKKIDSMDANKQLSQFSNVFEEAFKETKRNMRDTFGRIRQTEEFKEWKISSKVVIEIKPKE